VPLIAYYGRSLVCQAIAARRRRRRLISPYAWRHDTYATILPRPIGEMLLRARGTCYSELARWHHKIRRHADYHVTGTPDGHLSAAERNRKPSATPAPPARQPPANEDAFTLLRPCHRREDIFNTPIARRPPPTPRRRHTPYGYCCHAATPTSEHYATLSFQYHYGIAFTVIRFISAVDKWLHH